MDAAFTDMWLYVVRGGVHELKATIPTSLTFGLGTVQPICLVAQIEALRGTVPQPMIVVRDGSLLVPQAGIEPTTLALGVPRSVHLSYWSE